MAGHINLGYDDNAAFVRVSLQFRALLLRVIQSWLARHVCGGVQCGISFHFEAESLVLRKMPMEGVYFKTCQKVYFLFEFVDADEGTPHVVQIAAQLECRPVPDCA